MDENAEYIANINTVKGTMVIKLYKEAPLSVKNFTDLAKKGFYDGLTFHRVEPGFVIQGGDPKGNGTGGPGYQIMVEEAKIKHKKGVIAWAHAGDKKVGSQFYITLAETPFLDGGYNVFGEVIEGKEVPELIKKNDKINSIIIKKI